MPYKDPEKARENARERTARWKAKHPEEARASRKRSYDKNAEKARTESLAWYYANKAHVLARLRMNHLKSVYGLTKEQFAALGTVCGICGATEDSRTRNGKRFHLAVDHDKLTGKVRGLLCGNCNCGIGYLKHSEERLQAAIDYLRRTS